jgi:dihydrofolate reductase
MAKLRVHNLSISIDGYVAGPDQSLDDPLGKGGEALHEWAFATMRWQEDHGGEGGDRGLDNEFIVRGDEGIGATIMGRNMFGPIRGGWDDAGWRGWWGEDPPYHHPVFVLTHHPHDPIPMEGGTTFHFVTDGIESALARAVDAAGGADVRIGGGAATVQQYLRAGLVDLLHVAIAPVLLGSGERLFDRLDGGPEGYRCTEMVGSDAVTHVVLEKTS